MALLNPYEDAAAAFLQAYPLDTKVPGEEIIAWAEGHANGLASDLLIDNEGKKLSALLRHLRSGGASRSFKEDERFYVEVEDAKRSVFKVRRLADYVYDKSTVAFAKSVSGALSPLKQSQKAIDDIDKKNVSAQERLALETRVQELIDTMVPIRKTFHDGAVNRWVLRLEARGYTRTQAESILEILPTLQRELRLISKTRDED